MGFEVAEGPEAENRYRIARPNMTLVQPPNCARKRLSQCGVLVIESIGDAVRVLFYNPRGNANELRVGAVVEE